MRVIPALLALALSDTSAGIQLIASDDWAPDAEAMGPNMVFTNGNLRAHMVYHTVAGKGYTRLDILRINQDAVAEYISGSGYCKQGSTDEVIVEGGLLFKTWACSKKQSSGNSVAYLATGGWGFGERGVISWMIEIQITRQDALKFTEEEEATIDLFLRGFKFD